MASHKNIQWDEVGLGKSYDKDIAVKYGVTISTVTGARIVRGIPRYRSPEPDWANISDFSKTYNYIIAKRLGVTISRVRQARKRLGIAKPIVNLKFDLNWDEQPLGLMVDQHLADILGCTNTLVAMKRRERGIKPYKLFYRTLENQGAHYDEAVIDLYLHGQGIDHVFQYPVGPYFADWFIPSTNEIWEYLGLWRHPKLGPEYRERYFKKKAYYESLGYMVRGIFEKEMPFFKEKVDLKLLYSLGNFTCKGCGRKNQKHRSKGYCGTCLTRIHDGNPLGEVKERPNIDWLSIEGFATTTNAVLARRFGVNASSVSLARKKFGIPFVPAIDWSLVEDLGKVQDAVIGKRLGVSVGVVCYQRKIRGIPAAPKIKNVAVKVKRIRVRKKVEKTKLVDPSKVLIDLVSAPDLGVSSDNVISKRLGVDPTTVKRAREKLGIPARPSPYINWDEIDFSLSNRALAKILKRDKSSVASARKRRGLPAFVQHPNKVL